MDQLTEPSPEINLLREVQEILNYCYHRIDASHILFSVSAWIYRGEDTGRNGLDTILRLE